MILFCGISFLAIEAKRNNGEATNQQQCNPKHRHTVIAGLRVAGIGRRHGYAYIVSANITLAVNVSVLMGCGVCLIAARTCMPMVILIRLPICTVGVCMTKCRSDFVSAYRALNRIGLGSCCTVRSMCRLGAVDHCATVCNRADMPMVISIGLPLGAFGMTEISQSVPSCRYR